MEVSLVKEIGQSIESVDSFSVGKLMSAGLVCARHYHSVRLDLPMLRAVAKYVLLPKRRMALDILDECLRERRDNEHYHRALGVAVLVGFFLVGDFEAMDPKIIDIIIMLGIDNLVPMILAETLNDLDDPKLIVKAPREFILFLKGLNHEKINWVLSWWNIDTFIIRTYLQGCVVTAGLEKAFFYCPRCLKRQWGEFQAIPMGIFPLLLRVHFTEDRGQDFEHLG
uniref:Uncharacterized protein n=1 Tax=Fagus sylvatica TaxID=28930 RepID=A0A2N9J440_FAGSY